jgi:putative PIN family toxin of toxin-antitoxin system
MSFSIVIDTTVLFSALRSNKGASFKLIQLIGTGKFEFSLSVPLLIIYEDVLKRSSFKGLNESGINDFLNYICKCANRRDIYYLWRPFLKDPKDDMILEVSVESGSQYIITYNLKDFDGIQEFGIEAITPKEFLVKLGEIL